MMLTPCISFRTPIVGHRWLVALAVLVVCNKPLMADDRSTINGTVTDVAGNPVAGARVEWAIMPIVKPYPAIDQTTTDDQGAYSLALSECAPGYRLSVSKDGYAPAYFDHLPPWNFHLGSDAPPPPPENVEFTMKPEHTLDGVIVDELGKPLAGVAIKARTAVEGFDSSFSSPSYPTVIPGNGTHECTSDEEGRFHLDGLPPGNVNISVAIAHRHVNDANYAVDGPCTIVMNGSGRPGRIRAKVVDSVTGQPVPEFSVLRRHMPEKRTVSETSRIVEFDDAITAGRDYEVLIYGKGYAPKRGQLAGLEIDDFSHARIELVPTPPLLGRLVDGTTGKPIANASLIYGLADEARYFEWADWDKYIDGYHSLTFVQRATPDEQGQFWFCETADAPGALIILAPGYARTIVRAEKRPAHGDGGVVDITLIPESIVGGRLSPALMQQGPRVMHIWKEKQNGTLQDNYDTVKTDADGRFSFNKLDPGTYHIGVEQKIGQWRRTITDSEVTVAAGESTNIGVELLETSLSITP